MISKVITGFKRMIAPINPLAKTGVVTNDRITLQPDDDLRYYVEDNMPNSIKFNKFLNHHENDESNVNSKLTNHAVTKNTHDNRILKMSKEKVPLICSRKL